jgi:serine protease Do
MNSKESGKVRYAYGVAMALLLGGTAFSLVAGPVGAQVAQNAPAALAPRAGAPMSFADLAERLQPAVVNISTRQRIAVKQQVDPLEEFFRRFGAPGIAPGDNGAGPATRETGSLGSGFIISPDGYIVTNNHLIQSADGKGVVDSITVTLTNRKEYSARLVGRDVPSDLALLKIDGTNLPYVQWGDSTRARIGDWVLAIGDPYGVGSSVTAGIISALHRGITGLGAYDRYIQTDAAINMGNSGGPMFDLNGNVIGINSALISPTGASVGIGLAIPAELAKPVIDSLRRGQQPQRGYLGVQLQPIDELDVAKALGIDPNNGELVLDVTSNSPGERAGLKRGDVIVRVDGKEVTPEQTVSFLVANTKVGARVPIEVLRQGKRQVLYVTVAQRPSEEQLAKMLGADDSDQQLKPESGPTASASHTLGLSLQTLTPQISRALNLPADARGVVITAVNPNSDAADKGIQRGDLIISVDRQDVRTPLQVEQVVNSAQRAGRETVLVLIQRGRDRSRFIGLKIEND